MIAPAIGYLGVDRLDARTITGTLSNRQAALVLPVVLERGNHFARAERRQRLQAEVYADRVRLGRGDFLDLNVECHPPPTTPIFDKCTALGCRRKGPAFVAKPANTPTEIDNGVSIYAPRIPGEWNPA